MIDVASLRRTENTFAGHPHSTEMTCMDIIDKGTLKPFKTVFCKVLYQGSCIALPMGGVGENFCNSLFLNFHKICYQ
jgi:hypothetical protein